MKNVLLFAAIVVLGFAPRFAHAKTRISVFTDTPYLQRTASAGGVSASVPAGIGYGGGLSSLTTLGQKTDLELGAIYQVRTLSDTSRFPYLMLPVGLSFGVLKFLDLDLGGYYALAMGNMVAADGSSQSFAAGGYSTNDYGVRAGFKLMAPMGGATHFLLGAHYSYGLAELQAAPVSSTSLRWNGLDFMAGLTFGGN